MAIALNDFVILLILTILNVMAIVYTWKVGRVFSSKSWNFIIGAFVVLLLNRLISFLDIFGIVPYAGNLALIDQVYIPMIFIILITVGMMRIFYKVVSSMSLEKKIKSVRRRKKKKPRRYY